MDYTKQIAQDLEQIAEILKKIEQELKFANTLKAYEVNYVKVIE